MREVKIPDTVESSENIVYQQWCNTVRARLY